MESKPIKTIPIHDHLRGKLCDLYENDCIFDKFECVWGGDDKYVLCLIVLSGSIRSSGFLPLHWIALNSPANKFLPFYVIVDQLTRSYGMGRFAVIGISHLPSSPFTGTCWRVPIIITSGYTMWRLSMTLSCKQTSRHSRRKRLGDHYQGTRTWEMDRKVEHWEMQCSWTHSILTRKYYMPVGIRGRTRLL